MSYRPNHHRPRQGSRWLTLRYPAQCKVCGTPLPAGERGFWDPAARSVTCHALECCRADGLTRQEWVGSPVSGRFVDARTEHRVGSPAPITHTAKRVTTIRFASGETFYRNANGRCEDAPCCGCCTI